MISKTRLGLWLHYFQTHPHEEILLMALFSGYHLCTIYCDYWRSTPPIHKPYGLLIRAWHEKSLDLPWPQEGPSLGDLSCRPGAMIQYVPDTSGAQEDQPRCPAAGNATGGMPPGAMGGAEPGKGHLSELRLSKNTQGLEKWISAGSLGMRSLDHSESKRRQGLVGLSRLVQFLLWSCLKLRKALKKTFIAPNFSVKNGSKSPSRHQ